MRTRAIVRRLMPLIMAAATVIAVSAAPAQAASRSGSIDCANTFQPRLRIDSSATGNGSWQSKATAATRTFTFPAGAAYRYSPYQRVNWAINNGSGFFYAVSSTCVQ